mmetsp:Transcript_82343/g.191203  ORF Transcript_82343/g.191203 Transcript_82343/m.191203 type:complete len:696 (+) Transcript_82343:76-2163(+)
MAAADIVFILSALTALVAKAQRCDVENNIDYQSGESIFSVHNVESADVCCLQCSTIPNCAAWTFGMWADTSKPTACYMKSAEPTEDQKKPAPRLVSGVAKGPKNPELFRGPPSVPEGGFMPMVGMDCFPGENAYQEEVDVETCLSKCYNDHADCAAVVTWGGKCFFRNNALCRLFLGMSPGHTTYIRLREPLQAVQETTTSIAAATTSSARDHDDSEPGDDDKSDDAHEQEGSQCGKIEKDVDYSSGSSLFVIPHIRSVEQCCHKCLEVVQCKAWTWGLWANISHPSACYLKSAAPTSAEKNSRVGIISGLPRQRDADKDKKREKDTPIGIYKQCGGKAWKGGTQCATNLTCTYSDEFYSQCTLKPGVTVLPPEEQEEDNKQSGSPSMLFCWSMVCPGTYEPAVMTKQWELHAGLFNCDKHLIISNITAQELFQNEKAAAEIPVSVIQAQLWAAIGYGPHGHPHALNTPVFIKAWNLIVKEGYHKKYDWTAKLDVDAIIIVPRMRVLLGNLHAQQAVYLLNAAVDAVGNFLHGPVEVLSREAVEVYGRGADRCKRHVDYSREGEDYYLNFCLKFLNVLGVQEMRLLQDAYAWGQKHVSCNTQQAVFHPVKSVEEVVACVNQIGSTVFMKKFGLAPRGWVPRASTSLKLPIAAVAAAGVLIAAAFSWRRSAASRRSRLPWQPVSVDDCTELSRDFL